MCLGILRPDVWKPASSISAVLELIRQLLVEPDVDDAVETSIADQLKTDRKAFDKQARETVRAFNMTQVYLNKGGQWPLSGM